MQIFTKLEGGAAENLHCSQAPGPRLLGTGYTACAHKALSLEGPGRGLMLHCGLEILNNFKLEPGFSKSGGTACICKEVGRCMFPVSCCRICKRLRMMEMVMGAKLWWEFCHVSKQVQGNVMSVT